MWTITRSSLHFFYLRTYLLEPQAFISWVISHACSHVQYTLLCQRLSCIPLASFLFLFHSLCLVTRYADKKPQIQCCVNKSRTADVIVGVADGLTGRRRRKPERPVNLNCRDAAASDHYQTRPTALTHTGSLGLWIMILTPFSRIPQAPSLCTNPIEITSQNLAQNRRAVSVMSTRFPTRVYLHCGLYCTVH